MWGFGYFTENANWQKIVRWLPSREFLKKEFTLKNWFNWAIWGIRIVYIVWLAMKIVSIIIYPYPVSVAEYVGSMVLTILGYALYVFDQEFYQSQVAMYRKLYKLVSDQHDELVDYIVKESEKIKKSKSI